MKCPKCGKEVILQNKQVGVSEDGTPVFNEYAICMDCKKQWNLDKQRAKKAGKPAVKTKENTAPDQVSKAAGKPAAKTAGKPASRSADRPASKSAEKAANRPTAKAPARPAEGEQRPLSDTTAVIPSVEVAEAVKSAKKTAEKPAVSNPSAPKKSSAHAASKPESHTHGESEAPVRRKRTASAAPASATPASTRKRPPVSGDTEAMDVDEQTLGNIPSEKERAKRERIVKKNYEDMLSTDPSSKSASKKKTAPKPKAEPEYDDEDYDDDDYDDYDDDYITPRFRVLRVIFGILSIGVFAFFTYRGVISGLDSITSGSNTTTGTFYIAMALCMLVSGLLLLILQKRNSIVAFLLPTLLYLASAVIAFLRRGDDSFLLYGAIVSAVFALLFLILTIVSRGGDDYEDDDYDDPFEEDHDNY